MPEYLLAFACIFGINLLPAFGPPTWAVLVFFRLNGELALMPLVLGGAVAAASGRLVLAHGARKLRGRFSPERLEPSLQRRGRDTGTTLAHAPMGPEEI